VDTIVAVIQNRWLDKLTPTKDAFVRFDFCATVGAFREIGMCRFRPPVVRAILDRTNVDFQEYASVSDLVTDASAEIKA